LASSVGATRPCHQLCLALLRGRDPRLGAAWALSLVMVMDWPQVGHRPVLPTAERGTCIRCPHSHVTTSLRMECPSSPEKPVVPNYARTAAKLASRPLFRLDETQ